MKSAMEKGHYSSHSCLHSHVGPFINVNRSKKQAHYTDCWSRNGSSKQQVLNFNSKSTSAWRNLRWSRKYLQQFMLVIIIIIILIHKLVLSSRNWFTLTPNYVQYYYDSSAAFHHTNRNSNLKLKCMLKQALCCTNPLFFFFLVNI